MNTKAADFFGCLIQNQDIGKFEDSESELEIKEFLSTITPVPIGRKLVRIGKVGDGSYLLPDDFDGIAACYSPGVDNFKDFEDCVVNHYGIECHMCDAASDPESFRTALIPGKQTFRKKWLDVTGGDDAISLGSWIEETSRQADGDLMLQMDIEGAEYRNILETDDSVLRKFRILVIEFHGLDKISDDRIRQQVLLPVFRKLNRIFKVVHAHPNNYDGEFIVSGTDIRLSSFLELTLYRNDRIEEGATNRVGRTLIPHPKDIVNCPGKPPVFLDRRLLYSKRSWRSRLKILHDRAYYFARSVAREARDSIRGRRSY